MPTQNLAHPIARTIPIAHPFALAPDTPAGKNPSAPDMAPDKTASAPHPDDRTHTIAAIAKAIEVNEATLRRRWLPKLLEAYAHYPEPLRVEVRQTSSGTPVYEITEYGFAAIRAYKVVNQAGRGDGGYLASIRDKHPGQVPDKPAYLALIEPDSYTGQGESVADKSSMLVTLDAEILEGQIEDYHATQDATAAGAIALSNLLSSATQALTAAAHQQGRTAGAQAAAAWQQGANDAIAEVLQSSAHAAQGKAIE